MAKTIKFNLILDGNPVRTIEDLRENFSIEDVLDVYRTGLLQRWLKVRGYSEFLEKVNFIECDDNKGIITELIKIFEIEENHSKIEEEIEILRYLEDRKILLEEYKKSDYKMKEIIEDYHSGYLSVIDSIIENKDNMAKIKASIKEIEENYFGLFILDYKALYNNLIENAPLAIFAIIMNNNLREYFIPNGSEDVISNDTNLIYKKIKELVENKSILKDKLGPELKIFNGHTSSYWKDIESKGKKYMILSMEEGNFVRNAEKSGEELSRKDINGQFVIVDGIDYKSNNSAHELLYMEV